MWNKEYRIVFYSWEFATLQSFYRDVLRMEQMYGWYTSPVDQGCKFPIGENRLEIIGRHPSRPAGPAGMRLEALNIDLCYANLKDEPRLTVIEPLAKREWGEYSFCIKDPVGNWVEIFQSEETYPEREKYDCAGGYFTDHFTAIIYADDPEKVMRFYRDTMKMPVVLSWDRGNADRGYRLASAGGFTDIRQKTDRTPKGPAVTTIEASDINECFRFVSGREDAEIVLDLLDTWYGDRIFQVCDPENNLIEALAYRRNMRMA